MGNDAGYEAARLSYRGDIDGLRALAVLPVIAFHMGVQVLSGGFIGVDIFFVISGYLISSRILADIEQRKFSLLDFYVRRVRRIFPALAAMLIVTSVFAAIFEYPDDLISYGKSLVAATLSFSNVYFWSATDYFTPQAQTAALLHTWSLSVEEQYYVVFPPLMLLLFKWRRSVTTAMWVILTVSLVASSIVAFTDPVSAFYLPQYRMWEFLAGTMILRRRYAVLDLKIAREVVAALGVSLIVASIFLLNPKMAFPGMLALPACLGTALVIAAGEHGATETGRLLASKPARSIGLISYSLYLWHWPTIVFYKNWKPVEFLSFADKGLLACVILALSLISWRFIEQPFRPAGHSRSRVFGAAGTTAAALIMAGTVAIWCNGFPARFSAREQKLVAYTRDRAPARDNACFGGPRDSFADFDMDKCLAKDDARPDVLLFGDSHANHLWLGLTRHSGANVMELATNGCPPILASRESDDPLCSAMIKYALREIPALHPDLVLLSGRWQKRELKSLEKTIDWFAEHKVRVMISGPIPEYDAELPKLLALAEGRQQPRLWEKHALPERKKIDALVSALSVRKGVAYLSPLKALCAQFPHCRVFTPSGDVVQSDYGHLTAEGSDYIVKAMLNGNPIMDITRDNSISALSQSSRDASLSRQLDAK